MCPHSTGCARVSSLTEHRLPSRVPALESEVLAILRKYMILGITMNSSRSSCCSNNFYLNSNNSFTLCRAVFQGLSQARHTGYLTSPSPPPFQVDTGRPVPVLPGLESGRVDPKVTVLTSRLYYALQLWPPRTRSAAPALPTSRTAVRIIWIAHAETHEKCLYSKT